MADYEIPVIRQIGMVVQLEDGTMIQLHAKPGQCAGGTIQVEAEVETMGAYQYGEPVRILQRSIQIHIEGLTGYEYRVYRARPGNELQMSNIHVREVPTGHDTVKEIPSGNQD